METSNKTKEIINKTTLFIEDIKKSLLELNEECTSFIFNYDEYNNKNLYDASLLKQRMKDSVIKAVSDDL